MDRDSAKKNAATENSAKHKTFRYFYFIQDNVSKTESLWPAKITTSASFRASLLFCLMWMGLFLPSMPRDMPPRKQGMPSSSKAFLWVEKKVNQNSSESNRDGHECQCCVTGRINTLSSTWSHRLVSGGVLLGSPAGSLVSLPDSPAQCSFGPGLH